ncbi:MAG: FG-GAP repeat protein, partial [Actinomycetota bacterium]
MSAHPPERRPSRRSCLVALTACAAFLAAHAAPALPASPGVHGDFNGDGIADLAIGVPFEDAGSVIDAG